MDTLLAFTFWLDFSAMAISLWLAFYLLGRGFPSPITLRAVLVLLALSGFFFGAVFNIFHQVIGSASFRAALLVIIFSVWYSLTIQLLPNHVQKKHRWLDIGLYGVGVLVTIILLGTRSAFIQEAGNSLWVAHMEASPPFVFYAIFQIAASAGILYNLLSGPRIGLSPQSRFFFIASLLPICAVGYGILALVFPNRMPRLIQDGLVFAGVCLMGFSVARHQTLVERRTTLQDFPLSALAVLGLSGIYAWLVNRLGYPPEISALVMVLAITTHSIYDLAREFLERQRYKRESTFRKQIRRLESLENSPVELETILQTGLEMLCQTVDAGGGWIAIRQADNYVVMASHHSLSIGSRLPLKKITSEDLFQPKDPLLSQTAWIASTMTPGTQAALVAINPPHSKLSYSADDLDLLAEVADRIQTIISFSDLRVVKRDQITQMVTESQNEAASLRTSAEALMSSMALRPDPKFLAIVEEALRHLSDYIALGQSQFADWANVSGANHIERGRKLQQLLIQAIESLHPGGQRPREPLPREWFNYVVLHDAYVECIPNREIMARLYISEGTFNRTRRNALRGLAQLLLEKKQTDAE